MPERTENPISFRAIPGDSWRESFCRVRRGKTISNKSGEIIVKKLQSHTANTAKLPNSQAFLGIISLADVGRGIGETMKIRGLHALTPRHAPMPPRPRGVRVLYPHSGLREIKRRKRRNRNCRKSPLSERPLLRDCDAAVAILLQGNSYLWCWWRRRQSSERCPEKTPRR